MAKKDKEKSAREPYYLTNVVTDTGCARKHSDGGSADAPAEG